MKIIPFLALSLIMFLTGCASIVGETDQPVTINSSPDDAEVTITDETSQKVHTGRTPTTVQLAKSDGSYFGGKTYTVNIDKAGFESRDVRIESKANGWYIGGNLIFGGLIGWLVVDPLTGAMYNLKPDSVNATLGDQVSTTEDGTRVLRVSLVKDISEDSRSEMEYIGQI